MENIISFPESRNNISIEVVIKTEINDTDVTERENINLVKCVDKQEERLKNNSPQIFDSNNFFDAGETNKDMNPGISNRIEESYVEEEFGMVRRLRKRVTQELNYNKYSMEIEIKNETLGIPKLDSDVIVKEKCPQELKTQKSNVKMSKIYNRGKSETKNISLETEIKHSSIDNGTILEIEDKSESFTDSDYEMSTEEENKEISEAVNFKNIRKKICRSALSSRRNRYPCEICGKKFRSEIYLKSHCHSHTGTKVYKCEICGKGYGWQVSYQNHLMKHNGVNPYKCSTCGKVLSTKLSLKNHIVRIHEKPDKHFACDICERRFLYSYELKYHKKNHFNKPTFMCELCGKTSTSKESLQIHRQTHTGERPFKCDICNKGFIRKTVMKEHRRTHTDGYSNQCEICGKQYSSKGSLARHKRTHTEERPYKCNLCEKAFKCSAALYSHKDYHIGIKRHICKFCGKAFLNEQNMHKHKKRHIGVKKEKCLVCDKAFYTKQELRAHMKSHEPKRKRRKKNRVYSENDSDEISLMTKHPDSPGTTQSDCELPQSTLLEVENVQLENSQRISETHRATENK